MKNHMDKFVQYLRYHMVPDKKPKGKRKQGTGAERKQKPTHHLDKIIDEIGRPYAGMCLIFDWETFPYGWQKPRFAVYQIRGLAPQTRRALAQQGRLTRELLDEVRETGLVYEPINCKPGEIETLRAYAASHGMPLLTRAEFARDVLVGGGRWWKDWWCPDGKNEDRLIIGFNLPFDISRTAYNWRYANEEFYGGFTFKMCACDRPDGKWCGFHPPIQIYPIASRKHMFDWGAVSPPKNYQWAGEHRSRAGNFLDVQQFSRALLGTRGGFPQERGESAEHPIFQAGFLRLRRPDHSRVYRLCGAGRGTYMGRLCEASRPSL
jgi:hypothetical protein